MNQIPASQIIILDPDDSITDDDIALIALMIPQMLASAQLAQND